MNIHLPTPMMLWLEPSGACNLNCPGCPTAKGRGGGVMHMDKFIHIINQLPWLKLLNLWHRGEPLLAPELPEMIREATKRKIHTHTHSNGILLTRNNMAERLVNAGLSRIAIGIDGSDEITYQQFRRGGSLKLVEEGIKALVEARRRINSKKPAIIAECLVSRQTKQQLQAVHDLAITWGCDTVKFKTYRVPNIRMIDEALNLLPEESNLWRYKQIDSQLKVKRIHNKCMRLAYSALITWDGEVLPCCFDSEANHSFGNIFEKSWEEIWKGKQLSQFRHNINNGSRDLLPMCQNCTEGMTRLYLPKRQVLR